MYPTGWVSLPIGGGAIAAVVLLLVMLLPLALASPPLLDVNFRLPLRVTRSAISTLASVVSLGSPGSRAWVWWPIALAAVELGGSWSELARWRLLGCALEDESVFLWALAAVRLDSGAVVSPSSPEASRDSFWIVWFWSMSRVADMLLRLRFPAPWAAEFEDDMLAGKNVGLPRERAAGELNNTQCGPGPDMEAVDRPGRPRIEFDAPSGLGGCRSVACCRDCQTCGLSIADCAATICSHGKL